jgi:hypothetical protein
MKPMRGKGSRTMRREDWGASLHRSSILPKLLRPHRHPAPRGVRQLICGDHNSVLDMRASEISRPGYLHARRSCLGKGAGVSNHSAQANVTVVQSTQLPFDMVDNVPPIACMDWKVAGPRIILPKVHQMWRCVECTTAKRRGSIHPAPEAP